MKTTLATLALACALMAGFAPAAGATTAPPMKVRESVVSGAGVTLYITIGGVQRKCANPVRIQPEANTTGIRSSLTIKCPNGSMAAHLWIDHFTVVTNGRTRSCEVGHIDFGWVTRAKSITSLYQEWIC